MPLAKIIHRCALRKLSNSVVKFRVVMASQSLPMSAWYLSIERILMSMLPSMGRFSFAVRHFTSCSPMAVCVPRKLGALYSTRFAVRRVPRYVMNRFTSPIAAVPLMALNSGSGSGMPFLTFSIGLPSAT